MAFNFGRRISGRREQKRVRGGRPGCQMCIRDRKSVGSRKDMEKELIRDVMIRCKNNKSEAARILQIDRKTLYSKLKHFGLEDL